MYHIIIYYFSLFKVIVHTIERLINLRREQGLNCHSAVDIQK